MTQLVAITHPLTGKTYHMHPDLAAQQHHWVHPDPSVPTPAESLPLFNEAAVDQLVRRLALPVLTQPAHPTPKREATLEKAHLNAR